ncbi:MAG: Asp-tRNA(Asn)/Glu-tRNA(Gln) amidotransferase subunit GatC [Myxococcota bacterium]
MSEKVSLDEVRRVARLAYLELPKAEPEGRLLNPTVLGELAEKIGAILGYVEELKSVDTTGVEPTSHGVHLPPLLRADENKDPLDRDRALAGAPKKLNDGFAVPKIIE